MKTYCSLVLFLFAALAQAAAPSKPATFEGSWVWFNEGRVPDGAVRYFRKTFDLPQAVSAAAIDVTCDNQFVLYINGKQIGESADWMRGQTFDSKGALQRGRNVIAVRGTNIGAGAAGLFARAKIALEGGAEMIVATDGTWLAGQTLLNDWNQLAFDDSKWTKAHVLGAYGIGPWGTRPFSPKSTPQRGRFDVVEGFKIERVAEPELIGTTVVMTFDGRGRLLASQEKGPIRLVEDKNGDGKFESAKIFCDKVTNCQGLLSLNGDVYAMGNGPKGVGLYLLRDTKHEDHADEVKLIAAARGGVGDHGPHAVIYGPDGWVYIVCGNHAGFEAVADAASSPLQKFYEGSLLPVYLDPHGHAAGVKAPGGTMLRMRPDGSQWQLVSGGFRNQYDAAFNWMGELFTFDSDMEWDVALPWYRPVRTCHTIPGGDQGWRTSSYNWPEYYFDSLPAMFNVGRGSPTGVVFYDHTQFPEKYRGAFFACDWSMGRILAQRLTRTGATFKAENEEFIVGKPLNVTDIEVAPDGSILFSTGGRGTEGGIYRVSYKAPAPPLNAKGIEAALQQPQPQSAWAREKLRRLHEQLGGEWGNGLLAAANDAHRTPEQRVRALTLLQQFGPAPEEAALLALAGTDQPLVRACAVYLLGLHKSEAVGSALSKCLKDADALVRRRACEALVRSGANIVAEQLMPLLDDEDGYVRYAARVALQRVSPSEWADAVLTAKSPRLAINGILALNVIHATAPEKLLARELELLDSKLDDELKLDLARLIEVTLLNTPGAAPDAPRTPNIETAPPAGTVPAQAAQIGRRLLAEFPAKDWRLNREIAVVVSSLQTPGAVAKLLAELATEKDKAQQIHYAYCLRVIKDGWDAAQKRQMFAWFEEARRWEGGHSFAGYIEDIWGDALALLTPPEREQLLAGGGSAYMTRALVQTLDTAKDEHATVVLNNLYDRLKTVKNGEGTRDLKTAVLDALGRSARPEAEALLRKIFDDDSAMCDDAARNLARFRDNDNWPYLVRALETRNAETLRACVSALNGIARKPDDAAPYRAVILAAQRLGRRANEAVNLLARWSGEKFAFKNDAPQAALEECMRWFKKKFPNEQNAQLADSASLQQPTSVWSYDLLVKFLEKNPAGQHGSATRGRQVAEKVGCLKCHKFGNEGAGVGPDLTTLAQRFKRREIVESMIYPSKVISDQYHAQSVTTKDGDEYVGIPVKQDAASITFIQSTGTQVTIQRSQIEKQTESKISVMPEGILNVLTLAEIADLVAFLESGPKQSTQAVPVAAKR